MAYGQNGRRWSTAVMAVMLGAAIGCHSGMENEIHHHDNAALADDLDHGGDVNAVGSHGYTPLIYAARDGNAGAVRILLQHRARVNAQDDNGSTALMHAAEDGHREIARMLLDAGADPNLTNRWGYTALAYAGANHHADIASLIVARGGR